MPRTMDDGSNRCACACGVSDRCVSALMRTPREPRVQRELLCLLSCFSFLAKAAGCRLSYVVWCTTKDKPTRAVSRRPAERRQVSSGSTDRTGRPLPSRPAPKAKGIESALTLRSVYRETRLVSLSPCIVKRSRGRSPAAVYRATHYFHSEQQGGNEGDSRDAGERLVGQKRRDRLKARADRRDHDRADAPPRTSMTGDFVFETPRITPG